MFLVRPQSSLVMIEDKTPDDSLYDANFNNSDYEYYFECSDDEYNKIENENEQEDMQYYKYDNNNKKSKLIINNSLYKRAKKSNKRIKIKTLLKKNSLVPHKFENNSVSITSVYSTDIFKFVNFKSNSKLYIKYNIYRKFVFLNENNDYTNLFDDFYIKKIDRSINVFAKNRKKTLDSLSIKKFSKDNSIIINKSLKKSNDNSQQKKEQSDVLTLSVYTIDHNRVNDELNQTYDNLYLEFLISLQHREITPEDYEYLG